jgi:hypothetical protein
MKWRSIVGVGLIVSMALVSVAMLVFTAKPAPHAEFITWSEQRLVWIKQDLPGHGRIGYLSELPYEFHDMRGSGALFSVRYVLAPLQVSEYSDEDIVIGNFYHARAAPPLIQAKHLEIVRDYGDGLMLLRRNKQ